MQLSDKSITIGLLILGCIMAVVYGSFYATTAPPYNSPDETSQAYFIERLSRGDSLKVPIDTGYEGYEFVAPRSMRVADGRLVPASFIGLIGIYGTLGSFIERFPGMYVEHFVYGAAAVLGLTAFYIIIAYVWNRNVARISFLLALFFPGWWYYASLGLFPNVLLVSFVLWSVASYILYKQTGKHIYTVASALFVSLALLVRLAALPWVGFIWLSLFVLDSSLRKKEHASFYLRFTGLVLMFFVLPLLVVQQSLYGGATATGYVLADTAGTLSLLQTLFPGGLHPRLALANVWDYYVILFWYITIPCLCGAIYFFVQLGKARRIQRKYFFMTVVIAAWLSLYYGSWLLFDNINNEVSIGVAYVRYWLPIYLLLLPFAALIGMRIVSFVTPTLLRKMVGAVLLGVVIGASGYDALFRHDDSLFPLHETLAANKIVKEEVIALTEPDAIIISYRHDKVFFPDRDVIHGNPAVIVEQILPHISYTRPLYLYTIDSPEVIMTQFTRPLAEEGIRLTVRQALSKGTVYAIFPN